MILSSNATKPVAFPKITFVIISMIVMIQLMNYKTVKAKVRVKKIRLNARVEVVFRSRGCVMLM